MSATLLVLAGTGGAALTDGAREQSDLSSIDPSITSAAVTARSPLLNALALGVTSVGSTVGLVALTLLAALWLVVRRRQWRRSGVLILAVVGAAVLTVALKTWVGRTRPPLVDLISAPSNDPSFPSGHTLNSTVFFGMLILIVLQSSREAERRGIRSFCLWLWAVLPLAVGLSRVYLGYHWATDVVGGWVFGLGYLAFVVLVWTALAYPRHDTEQGSASLVEGRQ